MLKVEELNVYYDKIHAVKGVSFEVRDGEICTLIGANGAGKTTILQTISGLLRPKSGKISFDGVDITGHSPNKILVRGLAQVPEGRRVFGQMTVLENLEMGAFTRRDTAGLGSRFAAIPTSAKGRCAKRQDGHRSIRCDDAPNVTFGLLRNVEIGRALSRVIGCHCHSSPRWTSMLGPVSAGLSPSSKYSAGYDSHCLSNSRNVPASGGTQGPRDSYRYSQTAITP